MQPRPPQSEIEDFLHQSIFKQITTLNPNFVDLMHGCNIVTFTVALHSREKQKENQKFTLHPVTGCDSSCRFAFVRNQNGTTRFNGWILLNYPSNEDLTERRLSKVVKHNPFQLFTRASYAIFADNKLKIDPSFCEEKLVVQSIREETFLACFTHPSSRTAFDEIKVIRSTLASRPKITNSMTKIDLQKERYKGMEVNHVCDCGFMIWKNTPESREFSDVWAEEFQNFGDRDQVSFPYVVESLDLSVGVGKDVLLIDPHGCDEMHMLHWWRGCGRDGQQKCAKLQKCAKVGETKVASLGRWML